MSRRAQALAVVAVALGLLALVLWPRSDPAPAPVQPELLAVSPPIISNQSATPLMITGRNLPRGAALRVPGLPPIPTQFVDSQHLTAVLPAGLTLPAEQAVHPVSLSLDGASGVNIVHIVNDVHFPDPVALDVAEDGRRFFVASLTTDTVSAVDRGASAADATQIRVGDGPTTLETWRDGDKTEWLVVGHRFSDQLVLVRTGAPDGPQRRVKAVSHVNGLAVDQAANVIYASSSLTDRVHRIDPRTGAATTLPAGVNPGPLALTSAGRALACGNWGSSDLSLIDIAAETERRIAPGPGATIVGGPTAHLSQYVMGDKEARAIVSSDRLGATLVASIGPNVGPNPKRWEVSMNGGITVVAGGRFVRHVSLFRGVPQALAMDDERGRLYVADIAAGRIVVVDAAKLLDSDASAATAVMGGALPKPPPDFKLTRDAADFGTGRRNDVSLHTGPQALALTDGGNTLLALLRFTGQVIELDTSKLEERALPITRTHQVIAPGRQVQRRLGQIIYFTDVGNTMMSCDACHREGHGEGMLFTKNRPMRIYRSPSLRGISSSPPYFTPAGYADLKVVAQRVLFRNRYRNPKPTAAEVDALAAYVEAIAPLPNPYRASDGSLPRALSLPDGQVGDAVAGMAIFEGSAGCADGGCHPGPAFTADQSAETRAQLRDVGTPMALGLRTHMQDVAPLGFPPPSLVGVWDVFPLLMSGAAGLSVRADETLFASHPFALRRLLSLVVDGRHGTAAQLSARDQNDLLAYLLTL